MNQPKNDTTVGNTAISSETEETRSQDLSGLSLQELETLFDKELGNSDRLQAEADCLSRRSAVSLFRAGRVMSAIRKLVKPTGQWTKWQKSHKVAVTSAWQAIELFTKAKTQEAVEGLTRTQALEKFGINTPKAAKAAKSVTTKVSDRKLAKTPDLSVFNGGSQDDEQTTDDPQVDQPEVSAEPQPVTPNAVPAAQPEKPAQNIPLVTAMEYMHRINIKLDDLERDLKGIKHDEHLIKLIDQAICTLQRLRGDAATDIDAA